MKSFKIGKKGYKVLLEKYGTGVLIISDIKRKHSVTRRYKRKAVEIECQRAMKTMRLGKDQELEEALSFRRKKDGVPIANFVVMKLTIDFSSLSCTPKYQ